MAGRPGRRGPRCTNETGKGVGTVYGRPGGLGLGVDRTGRGGMCLEPAWRSGVLGYQRTA